MLLSDLVKVKLLSVTELDVNPYGYLEGNSYKTVHFLKNGQSYWLRTRNTGNNEVATAENSYAGYFYGIATLNYYNSYGVTGTIRLG